MTLAILKELSQGGFVNQKQEDKISDEYFEKLRIKAPDKRTLITSLSAGTSRK